MVAGLVVLRGRDRVWPRAREVDGTGAQEGAVTSVLPLVTMTSLHVTAAASLGLAPVPVRVSLRDAVSFVLEIYQE